MTEGSVVKASEQRVLLLADHSQLCTTQIHHSALLGLWLHDREMGLMMPNHGLLDKAAGMINEQTSR